MRRFLVLLLLVGSASLGARAAYACSCAGPPASVRKAVAESEVGFVGEVTKHLGGGVYEARVDGVLKGELGPAVRLKVNRGPSASCGTSLDRGPILYLGERTFEVNQCTWRWTGNDVGRVVGTEQLVTSLPSRDVGTLGPEPPPTRNALRWVALLAVVAVGAVVVRRRRTASPMPRASD